MLANVGSLNLATLNPATWLSNATNISTFTTAPIFEMVSATDGSYFERPPIWKEALSILNNKKVSVVLSEKTKYSTENNFAVSFLAPSILARVGEKFSELSKRVFQVLANGELEEVEAVDPLQEQKLLDCEGRLSLAFKEINACASSREIYRKVKVRGLTVICVPDSEALYGSAVNIVTRKIFISARNQMIFQTLVLRMTEIFYSLNTLEIEKILPFNDTYFPKKAKGSFYIYSEAKGIVDYCAGVISSHSFRATLVEANFTANLKNAGLEYLLKTDKDKAKIEAIKAVEEKVALFKMREAEEKIKQEKIAAQYLRDQLRDEDNRIKTRLQNAQEKIDNLFQVFNEVMGSDQFFVIEGNIEDYLADPSSVRNGMVDLSDPANKDLAARARQRSDEIFNRKH